MPSVCCCDPRGWVCSGCYRLFCGDLGISDVKQWFGQAGGLLHVWWWGGLRWFCLEQRGETMVLLIQEKNDATNQIEMGIGGGVKDGNEREYLFKGLRMHVLPYWKGKERKKWEVTV